MRTKKFLSKICLKWRQIMKKTDRNIRNWKIYRNSKKCKGKWKNTMSWLNKFICVRFHLNFSSFTWKTQKFSTMIIWWCFWIDCNFISKIKLQFRKELRKSGSNLWINLNLPIPKKRKENDALSFSFSKTRSLEMKIGTKLLKTYKKKLSSQLKWFLTSRSIKMYKLAKPT